MSSGSCLVDLGDSFVLTGAFFTGTTFVTQYNSAGLVQELAPLKMGRSDHGCTAYYTDNQPVIMRYYIEKFGDMGIGFKYL